MEKKYYFIVAAVVIVGVVIYLLSRQTVSPPQEDEQTPVKCAGKTVFRYKYPSKIFPVLINDYSTSFKIVSGVLGSLISDSSGSGSVSSDVKNTARQLRDTLNQDNIFFENTLKAYFLASNNDPCNDSLRYMYMAYIKEMTEKVIQLKQFVAQVSSPSPGSTATANPPHDSVLVVVDTAKGNVNAGTKNPGINELIIKKDASKLSSAIGNLKTVYKSPATRLRPSPVRLQP